MQKFEPNIDQYEPSLKEATAACVQFAELLDHKRPLTSRNANPFSVALAETATIGPWLTLSGKNGCGKTMLAKQIFAYGQSVDPFSHSLWLATDSNTTRRPKVVWLDEVNFIKRCKDGEYDLPEYLAEDWLVVVDDLGASRDKTGFAGDMLFRLCNSRIGKFTIFTTNFNAKQIAEQIDPRITSRLIRDGNRFINITAGDYAIRQLHGGTHHE